MTTYEKQKSSKSDDFEDFWQVASIRIFCFSCFHHQSVEVTLIIFVLNDTILFKFAFRKRLGYGCCDLTFVLQDLSIVELQKCIQLRRPIFHRHRNMTSGLSGRVVKIGFSVVSNLCKFGTSCFFRQLTIVSLRDLCNKLLHKLITGISCRELCHIFQVAHGVAGGVRERNFDVGGKIFNKFVAPYATPSNSTGLNSGVSNSSHSSRNSIVFRLCICGCVKLQYSVILRQHLHLADGDGVEFCQSLRLRHSFADENCIQVFQIG